MDEAGLREPPTIRRLFKSGSSRMLDGVCSGIADYAGIGPAVVRLALVALATVNFAVAIAFYLTGIVVIPARIPIGSTGDENLNESYRKKTSGAFALIGIIAAVAVLLFFSDYFRAVLLTLALWSGALSLPLIRSLVIPVALILAGSLLILRGGKGLGRENDVGRPSRTAELYSGLAVPREQERLFRSEQDRKIAGICGGMGEFLNVDSTVIRFVFIWVGLASFGTELIVYFVCILFIPTSEPSVQGRDPRPQQMR